MTERGSDIDFDFFDEPETQEAPERARPARPGPGGPRRPPFRPPAGLTPLLRLVGLVAFAIAVIVVLVLWVQSCGSDSERDAYAAYVQQVRAIGADSQEVGRELNTVLTTPGITQADLQERLGGLAQTEEQNVARARELSAPGRLREEQRAVVSALELRVSGLRRLADAFQQVQTPANRDPAEAGALLATQMHRFIASDVVWDDEFRDPAVSLLRSEGIGGVEVSDSNFLPNAEIATGAGMGAIYQRIRGASTGGQGSDGARHGNGIVSVQALPSGQTLNEGEDNFVTATADLAFEVTIENSGDAQEVRVTVRLTVEQSPRPIEKEQVINIINPGERKTVVFRQLGQIVQFAQKTTLRVEVEPVPNEENTRNNTASYPVTFSLTPPS
jgi:hypothetical protein